MSLSLALNTALTSLSVNQQALTVLSQNIANANTPGYSRQILDLQAVYVDGQGAGVDITQITRRVDQYLQIATQNQLTAKGASGVVKEYSDRAQVLLGQPGSSNDLSSSISTFFNRMQTLAQQPQSATQQAQAVQAATTLSIQFNQLARGLQDLRFQADQDILRTIESLNADLKTLYDTNAVISKSKALGRPVTGLQDAQDKAIASIAQYINVQSIVKSTGEIQLYTSNGLPLVDTELHQLRYTPAGGTNTFANDTALSAITLVTVNDSGEVISSIQSVLATSAPSSQVTTVLTDGRLYGLLQVRDKQLYNMTLQLDELASYLRDQVNAAHNSGSGYPGSNSYVGSRLVNASDFSAWTGSVRIAVLGDDGKAVESVYGGQAYLPPLTLDLSTLDTGGGAGNPSVQGLVDAINGYFIPQNKVRLGPLNDIQLMSKTSQLPNSNEEFSFDFNLQNLTNENADFYVTGVSVLDDTGAALSGTLTSTIPDIDITSYTTTASSGGVTVNVASTDGLVSGQKVYLSTPGATIDGINATDLTGFFVIQNVTATSFTISTNGTATAGATTSPTGTAEIFPPYGTATSLSETRTQSNGFVTADLTGAGSSAYYTVSVNVAVNDADGDITTSTITYRVLNDQGSLLNARYGARTASGNGTVAMPESTAPIARAMLVDADGNELFRLNGKYTTTQNGYLKIVASNSTYSVSIDSLNSKELGQPNNIPPIAPSNRGFSHFFGLNDLFVNPTVGHDADVKKTSAQTLAVQSRFASDPTLLSTGTLTRDADVTGLGSYAFVRNVGDNSVAQRLAEISTSLITFPTIGGLGKTTLTLGDYASQIIGVASSAAAIARSQDANTQTLLEEYQKQSSVISGVNLDVELANTIIYQNSYAASARIITVTNGLFDTLLQAFRS